MKNIFLFLFLFPLVAKGQIITTVAGNGTGGFTGDGVPATATGIYNPYGVGFDSSGNMFVGDALNHRIRKVNTSGIISTVAGTGTAGYNGDYIIATTAQLNFAHGMAVNRDGTIVIADMNNNRIRIIQTELGGIIWTIGGTGTMGYSGDGGPAVSANLNKPQGIFWDNANNVYFTDAHNHRLRKIDNAGIITTIAGTGTPGYSGDGGPATAAGLYYPAGVARDSVGNIYIADMYNHRIRRISTTGIITTVAGNGGSSFAGDGGPATAAQTRYPKGVYVDRVGNIIFTDTDNQYLRKINTITGIITSIAGTGVIGYGGDGGPATLAKLNYSQGVSVDSNGSIYIGDCLNNRIRKINCTPPSSAGTITGLDTVCIGSAITLTNSITGGSWSSSNTRATITTVGVVSGITTGLDTIKYTVMNSCAAVGAFHVIYVKPCVTTATINNATQKTRVYPNPAMNELNVSGIGIINEIVITNISGQLVYSKRYSASQVSIDISNMPKGTYSVTINGSDTQSFIKL